MERLEEAVRDSAGLNFYIFYDPFCKRLLYQISSDLKHQIYFARQLEVGTLAELGALTTKRAL